MSKPFNIYKFYLQISFSREKREAIARIKDELRSKGCEVLPDKKPEEHFDSNCITPVGYIISSVMRLRCNIIAINK